MAFIDVRAAVIGAAFLVAFFGLGIFPILKLYIAEQYPTGLRGAGTGLGESAARIVGGVLAPFYVPFILKAGGVSAVFLFVALLAVIFLVPLMVFGRETARVTIEKARQRVGLNAEQRLQPLDLESDDDLTIESRTNTFGVDASLRARPSVGGNDGGVASDEIMHDLGSLNDGLGFHARLADLGAVVIALTISAVCRSEFRDLGPQRVEVVIVVRWSRISRTPRRACSQDLVEIATFGTALSSDGLMLGVEVLVLLRQRGVFENRSARAFAEFERGDQNRGVGFPDRSVLRAGDRMGTGPKARAEALPAV